MKRSSLGRLAGLGLLFGVPAVLSGAARAEPAKGSPAATVPLPPPAPPARPDGLVPTPPDAKPDVTSEARPEFKPQPAPQIAPQAIPQITPLPPERPPELTPPPPKEEGKGPGTPSRDAPAALPEAPLPPARPPELSGEAALALKVSAPDDTACLRRLERLGARFEPAAALANGQCSAPRPLTVTALADGIALEPAATLTCGAAEALARWTTEVQVAAQREIGEGLTKLSLGGTYVCRGQNHDTDAKLSEHSFANAIDVMGYGFARRAPVKVTEAAAGLPEAAFLAATRASACRFFRTVLGPGSDAAHGNHLHLDERERTAGHRLCQ